MAKAKINYYLLAIFIILLSTNIYFYFLKDKKQSALAQNGNSVCQNFNLCLGSENCDGIGGPGDQYRLTNFSVQTFLCGQNASPGMENSSSDPWLSALQDNKPNLNVSPPPTTTASGAPELQTCNVTAANEPINVSVSASSTGQRTLWVIFKDPNGTERHVASTTGSGRLNLTANYSPPYTSPMGNWKIQASICSGQSKPIGENSSNCDNATSTVKVYKYQCGSPAGGNVGKCYAVLSKSSFYQLGEKWCSWWINKDCSGGVSGR